MKKKQKTDFDWSESEKSYKRLEDENKTTASVNAGRLPKGKRVDKHLEWID